MSDMLHCDAGKLMLGSVELRPDDRIGGQIADVWHAGTVEFTRHWRSFYIQLPNKTIWQWEGLPVRLTSPRPGTPPAK